MPPEKIGNYADLLYNPNSKPLIIAVTGFTGSGCSSMAEIMCKPKAPTLPAYPNVRAEQTTVFDESAFNKLKKIGKS